MPHEFHNKDVATGYSKVQKIVGHTERFRHPTEKAADLAYYQNEKADPLTMPTDESVGP